MPARPGAPQVMEAQPGHAGSHSRFLPSVITDLACRRVDNLARRVAGMRLLVPSRHRKNSAGVLAKLMPEHAYRLGVQRHVEIPGCLRLVGVDPCNAPAHIDLLPLAKLRARLLASKPSDARGRFVQPGDRWHRVEPAAQVRVMQDFRDLCQMSI